MIEYKYSKYTYYIVIYGSNKFYTEETFEQHSVLWNFSLMSWKNIWNWNNIKKKKD